MRLDRQHATVVEELRSGAIPVSVAPPAPSTPTASPPAPPPPVPSAAPTAQKSLTVDLLNPRTWLTGKQATLYLIVRDRFLGTVLGGVRVSTRIEGGCEKAEVSTLTAANGHAQLQFEMPRLVAEDAALVIEAVAGEARGQLRFQLRAKPKVPAS
jgi:hypothetical protein